MKIAIDNIIFADKKYRLQAFQLLALLIELRHEIVFPKKEEFFLSYQSIKKITCFKPIRDEYSSFFKQLEENFKRSALGIKPDIFISITNLNDALIYLKRPLYILLENEFNDCHFMEAIIKHFGDDFTNLAFGNGWIEFKHAGGTGEVYKFIQKELKKCKNNFLPRLFTMVDSDALTQADRDDKTKTKPQIQNLCEENKILERLHILYKREMENYLTKFPNTPTILGKTQQKQYEVFINAFKAKPDIYKNFCDIKKEFSPYFTNKDITAKFPLLFLSENKASLSARDGQNELQIIADKIKNLL